MNLNLPISDKPRRKGDGVYYMGVYIPFDVQKLLQRMYTGKLPFDHSKRIEYLCAAIDLYTFYGMFDNVSVLKEHVDKELGVLDYLRQVKGQMDMLSGDNCGRPRLDDVQATSSGCRLNHSSQRSDKVPFVGTFVKFSTKANDKIDNSDFLIQAVYENLVAANLLDKEQTSLQNFKMVMGYQKLSKSNPQPIVWMGDVNVLAYFVKQMIERNLILDAENKWRVAECNFVLSNDGRHPSTRSLRQARQPRESMLGVVDKIFPRLPGLNARRSEGVNGCA